MGQITSRYPSKENSNENSSREKYISRKEVINYSMASILIKPPTYPFLVKSWSEQINLIMQIKDGRRFTPDAKPSYYGFTGFFPNLLCTPLYPLAIWINRRYKDYNPIAVAVGTGALFSLYVTPIGTAGIFQKIYSKQKNGYTPWMYGTMRKIVRDYGFLRLWNAAPLYTIHTSCYIGGFTWLQPKFSSLIQSKGFDQFTSHLMGGALAGLIASAISHPAEVVNLIRQTDFKREVFKGNLDAVKKVYASRGLMGFTVGFIPRATALVLDITLLTGLVKWMGSESNPPTSSYSSPSSSSSYPSTSGRISNPSYFSKN